MSTLAYASLTTTREAAAPGTSTTISPGVGTYMDAFAALVPAEILTLHAVIISLVTETTKDASGNNVTRIVPADMNTVKICFWVLIVLSMCLYAFGRLTDKKWDRLDYLRVLIPPLAFAGWAMLQKMTAFDAVWQLPEPARTITALFMGVVLGLAAVALAYQIDKKTLPASL